MELPPNSDRLKPYVKCIWTLRRTYSGADTGEVLWPDGCKEIIFQPGRVFRDGRTPLPASFVMGTLSGYRRLEAAGELLLYGIRLYPWGLYMVSDQPVRSFNDRFMPVAQWLGKERSGQAAALEQRLTTPDMEEAQSLLESFLEPLIDPDKSDPILFAVLDRLFHMPAEYKVADAVRDSGLSQRQFERRCMAVTGLSPKRLHVVARFNRVRIRLLLNPALDLHDLMVEAGYYDYAHFAKDFRQCLGLTPARFRAWAGRLAADHGPADVEFLQDNA
jgi:AraC-like DNA-binding protein